jgi:hypothetical protein
MTLKWLKGLKRVMANEGILVITIFGNYAFKHAKEI